ncbi:hypothetical protein RUND412_011614 [Rhizina undulata]
MPGPSPTTTTTSQDLPTAPGDETELNAVVDDLLDALSTKFTSVSAELFNKIEEMSKRLDAMEASLQASSTTATTTSPAAAAATATTTAGSPASTATGR